MTDNGNTAGPSANISPVATMHDFARYMADAARAMEDIPLLERRVSELREALDKAQQHSGELERTIHDMRSTDNLTASRLAEVERERDTFRQQALNNAVDRDRLISSVETAFSMVQDDIRQVAPAPAPEPDPKTFTGFEPAATPSPAPEVQPEPTPSVSSVSTSAELDPSQKYAGLIYADYPHYVPKQEWYAGGGTCESYYANSVEN